MSERKKERKSKYETESLVNNHTGKWEVKPNVVCSTSVSFYSSED